MAIPVRLLNGQVSIYGAGSIQGFQPLGNNLQFGLVDQLPPETIGSVSVGQSVMFNAVDLIAKIQYNYNQYYIVPENKIILVENSDLP